MKKHSGACVRILFQIYLCMLFFIPSRLYSADPPKTQNPPDLTTKAQTSELTKVQTQGVIQVKWPIVDKAYEYEVQMEDKKNVIYKFVSKENHLTGKLNCGEYKFKVRSFDSKKTASPWGAPSTVEVPLKEVKLLRPKEAAKINSEQEGTAKVKFQWEPLGQEVSYDLEVLDEDNKVVASKKVTQMNSFELMLPVAAKYFWRVTPAREGCISPKVKKKGSRFDLIGYKLGTPVVSSSEINEDDPQKLIVSWTKPTYSKTFDIKLEKKNEQEKWVFYRKIEDQSSNSINPLKLGFVPGLYRISVIAKAPYRTSSNAGIGRFEFFAAIDDDFGHFDISAGYVYVIRRYSASNEEFSAQISNQVTNTYNVGLTGLIGNRFGFFAKFQQGSQQLNYHNPKDGQDVPIELKYTQISAGPMLDIRKGAFNFVSKINIATDDINVLVNEGQTLKDVKLQLYLSGISLGVLFDFYKLALYLGGSANFLAKAKPPEISDLQQFGGDFYFEKKYGTYFSTGIAASYDNMTFNYQKTTQQFIQNTIEHTNASIYLKLILH